MSENAKIKELNSILYTLLFAINILINENLNPFKKGGNN
jgi:hypothetical protein